MVALISSSPCTSPPPPFLSHLSVLLKLEKFSQCTASWCSFYLHQSVLGFWVEAFSLCRLLLPRFCWQTFNTALPSSLSKDILEETYRGHRILSIDEYSTHRRQTKETLPPIRSRVDPPLAFCMEAFSLCRLVPPMSRRQTSSSAPCRVHLLVELHTHHQC
jgi:hypothetical protein